MDNNGLFDRKVYITIAINDKTSVVQVGFFTKLKKGQ